ncbi:MAG: hypothetical protein QXI58_06205 [Candidatus Micrarchaeia archaeon]
MTNEFKILMNELTIFEKILLIFGLILFSIICVGIFIHSNPCQDLKPIHLETPNEYYSLYAIPQPIIINNNLTCIYRTIAVPNINP